MKIDLTGKRALVTGGDSGIGAAIVTALAAAGAGVAINYREDSTAADRMVETLGEPGRIFALRGDVSDADAVTAMFATLDGRWNGLDLLVNNAGIDGRRALAWESEPAAWRKVVDVNLTGAYLVARQALQRMIPARSGVIVNTSSVHQQIAWSGYSAYAASKAGLAMLSKTLAQEAAPHGVRVLCVAPGAIATPINADVREDAEGRRDLLDKIPLGFIGVPEDIAGMVVVLASDIARYMTATTVFIDGGMTDHADFMHGG